MSRTKIYAVVDTNVIVSAMLTHNPTSNPGKVLDAIYDFKIIPVYNDEILEEYYGVLRRKKFPFTEVQIEKTINAIREGGIHAERIESSELFPDPKDIVFYEVSLSVDGAYLVTGNKKHFPIKTTILTPAEMVALLNL